MPGCTAGRTRKVRPASPLSTIGPIQVTGATDEMCAVGVRGCGRRRADGRVPVMTRTVAGRAVVVLAMLLALAGCAVLHESRFVTDLVWSGDGYLYYTQDTFDGPLEIW